MSPMKWILSLSMLTLTACDGSPWQVYKLLKHGAQELEKQNLEAAKQDYLDVLELAPHRGEGHYNLALTQSLNKESEAAVKEYQQVESVHQGKKSLAELSSSEKELLFRAHFNRGELWGKASKYDPALEAYQAALDIKPDSKETKTNIELLIQQQQQQQQQKSKDGQSQDQKNPQDQKDKDKKDQDQKDQDKDKENKDKHPKDKEKYDQSPKYKPRNFQGKELSEGDVKKILGELKRQEDKIRADFNRRDAKEQPRDKDW